MKQCYVCQDFKELSMFHKHSGMADGHLNKCKKCVQEYVANWRLENPDCRKIEHSKNRERKGFETRQEYFKRLKENAIGRSATLAKYGHKRRARTQKEGNEFDLFAIEEASKLCKSREKVTGFPWHIDHIIPLMHKRASGLHNAFNIQVVPASWNVKKSNKSMEKFLGY